MRGKHTDWFSVRKLVWNQHICEHHSPRCLSVINYLCTESQETISKDKLLCISSFLIFKAIAGMENLCWRLCWMSSRSRQRGGCSGGKEEIIKKREKILRDFFSRCKVNAVPCWQSVLSVRAPPSFKGGPAIAPAANRVGLKLDWINLATNGNKLEKVPRQHFTWSFCATDNSQQRRTRNPNVWGLLSKVDSSYQTKVLTYLLGRGLTYMNYHKQKRWIKSPQSWASPLLKVKRLG